MHRSSESIGAIAAALAKAQAELTNPEKSLTATIATPGPRANDRTFRYAPLSSGLDIVRKGLGQHEIATVQTTAIDADFGIVRLNTVLAHSSGEWISSEWPVCSVNETATPHRMGAALTYARRYALFTLVGIAGEDDIDAPDIPPPQPPTSDQQTSRTGSTHAANPTNGVRHRSLHARSESVLPVSDSASLRDKIILDLDAVASADGLTEWAARQMSLKNSLTAGDAASVEKAFRVRLESLVPPELKSTPPMPATLVGNQGVRPDSPVENHLPGIDKSVLALSEPRRYRDKAHLRFVAQQACLVCGRQPSDPHHLSFAQLRALGRKVSDEFTVPLCRTHHRDVHRYANEPEWWKKYNLDPLTVASALWGQTHPVGPAPQAIQEEPEMLNKHQRGLNRKTKPIDPADTR